MTISTAQPALQNRTVGDIATTLPGATAVFRKLKIDFCCNGDLTLDEAANRRGVDLAELEGRLGALSTEAKTDAEPTAMESGELIDYIKTCYHEAHRRVLPELIKLSRKVEAVHRDSPDVPAGLADVLQRLENELELHMSREEATLFPAMREAGMNNLAAAIGDLRHEHDDQGAALRRMESLTDDFTLPEGACRSWQALYVGAAQLADDLMEHIHLENNVLFPRFAAPEGHV